MIILGIDAGLNGAFSVLNDKFEIIRMDTMPKTKSKPPEIAVEAVWKILEGIRDMGCQRAAIELISAFALSSTTSFSFGRGYGALEVILKKLKFDLVYIRPCDWTRLMHFDIDRDLKPKAKSLIAAKKLWPDESFLQGKCRKPSDGKIDSCLIGTYALRTHAWK